MCCVEILTIVIILRTPPLTYDFMIRENKIKELVAVELANRFMDIMQSHGFKYSKTKAQFVRQQGVIHQIIRLKQGTNALYYNEATEELCLNYCLLSGIEVPKYSKWYTEQTGEKKNLHISVNGIESDIDISIDALNEEDFYEPTASQQFKRGIVRSLAGSGGVNSSFEEVISEKLPALLAGITRYSDLEKLLEMESLTYDEHLPLWVFGGYTEKAVTLFDERYQLYINKIKEKQLSNPNVAVAYIGYLDAFIVRAQKLLKRTYENPFTDV